MLNADLILGFAGSVLAKKYDDPTPIPDVHREWWELCCSDAQYVAIAAPRGHGKSTAITKAYLLAEVLFKQSRYVLIVSDTESQATLFLNDVKDELKTNEHLIELFQVDGFDKDTETDIEVRMKDGHCFKIAAVSSGGKLRGRKWKNYRPDLILGDDLENEELVYNGERRDKFRRWFYGSVIPAISAKGKIRIVGTILHLDSLLNRLMPKPFEKNVIDEELKLYYKHKKEGWKSVLYRAHNKDFSKILWPTRYTKEFFQNKKSDFDSQGMPDVYAQEYLNYPMDESQAIFQRGDLIAMREPDYESHKRYFVGADFAVSTAERADYTALVIVGQDEKGVLHVEEVKRGRWDTLEIIEQLFSVQKRYNPDLFFFEKGTIEKALGPILSVEMVKRSSYLNFAKMHADKDKVRRAKAVQKIIRAGGMRFDKKSDWWPDFEDELTRFPKTRNDDMVDALAWMGLGLDQFVATETAEELEDEEYAEFSSSEHTGRNKYTGY